MTDMLGLPEDPDERTSGEIVAWLDALAAAGDEDELFAILTSLRPPAAKLARQQIRGRLVKLLSEKLKELESGAPRRRPLTLGCKRAARKATPSRQGLRR